MITTDEPYDWAVRFSAELLLIFAFALVLLPSLWKLAMSRPGLIIVFSRVSSKKNLLIIFYNPKNISSIFYM
jgi:hypothetical protein